jgi:RNA polymerase sigma factor (sigma-70 family)
MTPSPPGIGGKSRRRQNRWPLTCLYYDRRIASAERTTMSAPLIGPALRHLRRLAASPEADPSDAQLLRRFVSQQDESAFELLVWRHGPMVYDLCRRVVRDGHDAEDAFQATLLVLARKAASISKHESLGSWLYKVAYRVALRARDGARRRARHERPVANLPAVGDPHAAADASWAELRLVLDEELSQLPEKHREPVVLCYLEGLTNEEAARQLACPVGTLKTRLAQARRLLGARLTRRGLAVGATLATAGVLPATARRSNAGSSSCAPPTARRRKAPSSASSPARRPSRRRRSAGDPVAVRPPSRRDTCPGWLRLPEECGGVAVDDGPGMRRGRSATSSSSDGSAPPPTSPFRGRPVTMRPCTGAAPAVGPRSALETHPEATP